MNRRTRGSGSGAMGDTRGPTTGHTESDPPVRVSSALGTGVPKLPKSTSSPLCQGVASTWKGVDGTRLISTARRVRRTSSDERETET